MKVVKASWFTVCLLQLYTTAFTTTVPSSSKHSAQILNILQHSNITLPDHNATLLGLPPDPCYNDYPTRDDPMGELKFFSFGPPLKRDDRTGVLAAALDDCVSHAGRDIDSPVGPQLKIYYSGDVQLVLAPKPAMLWKMWVAALDRITAFAAKYPVAFLFEILDDELGDIGGGWLTLFGDAMNARV